MAQERAIEMCLDEEKGLFVPEIADGRLVSGEGIEFDVCPGKGMPIARMSQEIYGDAQNHVFELGYYRHAVAAHSTDAKILDKASSGGVMIEIASFLLEQGLVDGVTATKFRYTPGGPKAESYIARSLDDLLMSQGSKYCPTMPNLLVRECIKSGMKYLFVGTPCQVGALRMAIEKQPELRAVFPHTMANFCGGFRDYRHMNTIIRRLGLEPGEASYFQFRGGGQPGSLLVQTRDGKSANCPYPQYDNLTDITKLKRCWYCVDVTGELADFSCGDAWIPRFLEDDCSWSLVLARSQEAEKILGELPKVGRVETKEVTAKEIVESQMSNITSKRYRQYKRMAVSKLLGMELPVWDLELPRDSGSYLNEIRILLSKSRIGPYLRKATALMRSMQGR